jgi:predicted RecB family nuclease
MPAINESNADNAQSGSAVADQPSPSGARLLTPTKISAWLECSHHLSLSQAVEAGTLTVTTGHLSAFARLLMEKGMDHERAQLQYLQSEGRSVAMVPERNLAEESFEQWCDRVRPLLAEGHEIVYQFPMIHEGIRGVADFLIKVDTPSDLGAFSYEPADAKLARLEAKPAHVLQLCFYADGLAALQGTRPANAHIFLGSGHTEAIAVAQVEAYWHRVRGRIFEQLNAETPMDTVAEPCQHCEFCEFADHCDAQWRDADAIHFVSGITRREREKCAANEITTLAGLAESEEAIVEIRPERNEYLRNQARLQAAAIPGEVPPWERRVIHEPTSESDVEDMDGPDDFRLRLPAPNPGDVMLDFEGHPFWSAEAGLFFLFGWLGLDPDTNRPGTSEWIYDSLWSHSREEEAAHTADLITWLAHRREQFPGMHVYHYNHTERSGLERLAAEHGAGESALAALISDGVFVDLYDLVCRRVQIGAESYGLKVTEILAGYRRSEEIGNGAGAVVQYEQWIHDAEPSHLTEIAAYNEEDVRATLAVRNWLATEVLAGEPWRELPEVEDTEREENEFDLVIAELMATGVEEHRLLGHLLGYWWREGRTYRTQRTAIFDAQMDEQLDNREVIAGLEFRGELAQHGQEKLDKVVFAFPPQETELTAKDRGQKLLFRFPSGLIGFSSIRDLDLEEGTVTISWKEEYREAGGFPSAVITEDWVHPKPKPEELLAFARRQLSGEHHPADAARLAVLRREIPLIEFPGADGTPDTGRIFSSDLEELTAVIPHLTDGCLAVQGPPGTGKTYIGARLIAALVAAGQRVGVTATSHKAIDNLLWRSREPIHRSGSFAKIATGRASRI